MLKNHNFLFILFLFLYFHSQSQEKDFTYTSYGFSYKIIQKSAVRNLIQPGDLLEFSVIVKNFKDSLIAQEQVKDFTLQAQKSKADLSQIFTYLAKGDSAVFHISVDSLIKNSGETLPPFFPLGTVIKYYFKISDVKTKLQVEQEKQMKIAARKAEEEKIFAEYARKNNLKTLKTASGLQYAIIKQGSGRKPNQGEYVNVNYTGSLPNGKVFDSSIESVAKANQMFDEGRTYEPISFMLGKGKVIKGWDEGLTYLPMGSKAILLIPSYLAYGERGAGEDIPPNSPLIFEVELVSIGK